MKENGGIIKTVKTVVVTLGSVGVAGIVVNAVRHVSPTSGVGAIVKVATALGTAMLSGFAADAVADYADERIDKLVETLHEDVKITVETGEIAEG